MIGMIQYIYMTQHDTTIPATSHNTPHMICTHHTHNERIETRNSHIMTIETEERGTGARNVFFLSLFFDEKRQKRRHDKKCCYSYSIMAVETGLLAVLLYHIERRRGNYVSKAKPISIIPIATFNEKPKGDDISSSPLLLGRRQLRMAGWVGIPAAADAV